MSQADPGTETDIAAADLHAALERAVRSVAFARSPQLQRLLTFLVQETIAGRGDRLKEYVIGLEVFERPASFDPRVDSLVRVEARRLRAALGTYYTTDGRNDPLVIEVPKGTYVPSFRPAERPASAESAPPAGEGPRTDAGLHAGTSAAESQTARPMAGRRTLALRSAGLALVLLGLAALGSFLWSLRSRPVRALSERDLVVLAGVDNSTGDAIFDETVRQRLATELERSPFLNLVSERRVAQVLALMNHSTSDRLGSGEARELCLRAGGRVVIAGSIDRLGSQYVIGLTATECSTGDALLHVQEQAPRKEAVLRALGKAVASARGRLGESLASVRQFGAPVEDETTASLEALQAYSLGRRTARERGSPADIPYYRRALEIDPGFAAAHAALGVSYMNQGQPALAGQHLERAYQLRDHVTERERYRISAYYYQAVTGELERAVEVYELWKASYPREFAPSLNLGLAHVWLGDYEKALSETREALRVEPGNILAYTNLAALLIKLDRPSEASGLLDEAQRRGLTSRFLRLNLCYLAFLRGDPTIAEQQLKQSVGSPGDEAALLALQSDDEAHAGRLQAARALSARAVDSARRAGSGEAAATWMLTAALREVELGHAAAAAPMIREALALSTGRDVTTLAALAAARAGAVSRAEGLLLELERQYPRHTVIARYWAPTIRAAIELRRGRYAEARRHLQAVSACEFASPPPVGMATLYPVYLRGEAFLGLRDGPAASLEFQKIVGHPGLVLNFPLHALSQLQLARARAMSGDEQSSRRAYDAFLALWQDADAGEPVLRRARTERGRLH